MLISMRPAFLSGIIAITFGPTTAAAELTMTIAPDFAMAAMMRQVRDSNQGGDIAKARFTVSGSETPKGAAIATTTYVTSPVRRRANLAQFVEKSRKADPSGVAAVEEIAAEPGKFFGAMEGAMAAKGLRLDNVADAYTVYWTTAWQAANRDDSDPSRATMQAVKAQAARALASTPEMAQANDAIKQEFAEAMLVQSLLIAAAVEQNKGNDAMLRQIGDAVRKGAKASGLDLDAMTLTEAGFRPARKTGAADPAPGTPHTELAGAIRPAAPAAAAGNPPYLLMAAAGGAGIGGAFVLGKLMSKRG